MEDIVQSEVDFLSFETSSLETDSCQAPQANEVGACNIGGCL